MAADFPIELAVTPRFDTFYALYTLTNPAPTTLGSWKERAALRLPRDFERVARRVAPVPLFWPLLADAVQSSPGELTFDELLNALRDLPPAELKANVVSGIFHDRAASEALLSKRRTLRHVLTDEKLGAEPLLTHFGLRPYTPGSYAANAIATLLAEPESYRDELVLVLERFWNTGFKRDWTMLEQLLRAEVFRLRELREKKSLPAFARSLNLPVTIDEKNRRLTARSATVAEFYRVDRAYIMPSPFNVGRWWARYEGGGGRVRLYFPVALPGISPNDLIEPLRVRRPAGILPDQEINAEQVFRALGDTTRYAIASILARNPTTSADLARQLNVSKPTITHHIQALRSANLVIGASEGGPKSLSLNAETIRQISDAALEQLFSGKEGQTLSTTRKRRK